MAKRRAMKLFAVAALAGTSTAHASPGLPTPEAAARVDWSGTIEVTAIQPRVLEGGRPAAGNTLAKPSAVDQTRTALASASLAYQATQREPIAISPRLLVNYRPACGNTGGKIDRADDCTAAQIAAAAAYDKAYAKAATSHYAKVSAAYTTLMAATGDAVRADPTLKARLLVNERPACGNTMGKASPPSFCRIGEERQ